MFHRWPREDNIMPHIRNLKGKLCSAFKAAIEELHRRYSDSKDDEFRFLACDFEGLLDDVEAMVGDEDWFVNPKAPAVAAMWLRKFLNVLGKSYFLPEFRHVTWLIHEIEDEGDRARREAEGTQNEQGRRQCAGALSACAKDRQALSDKGEPAQNTSKALGACEAVVNDTETVD